MKTEGKGEKRERELTCKFQALSLGICTSWVSEISVEALQT